MEENGHSSSNARASHNIGRLGNLVRVTGFGVWLPFVIFMYLFLGWLLKCIHICGLYLVCRDQAFVLIFFSFCQEHDDFFELISSKYLSETRYSVAVQAAAGRLLLSCSLTWIVRLLFF